MDIFSRDHDPSLTSTIFPHSSSSSSSKICDATRLDLQKALASYIVSPVGGGYEISSVQVVFDEAKRDEFLARCDDLLSFSPRSSEEEDKEDEDDDDDSLLMKTFDFFCKPYEDPNFPNLKFLPVWSVIINDSSEMDLDHYAPSEFYSSPAAAVVASKVTADSSSKITLLMSYLCCIVSPSSSSSKSDHHIQITPLPTLMTMDPPSQPLSDISFLFSVPSNPHQYLHRYIVHLRLQAFYASTPIVLRNTPATAVKRFLQQKVLPSENYNEDLETKWKEIIISTVQSICPIASRRDFPPSASSHDVRFYPLSQQALAIAEKEEKRRSAMESRLTLEQIAGDFRVKMSDFDESTREKIGEGGFSIVWRVTRKSAAMEFAHKVLKKQDDPDLHKKLLNEAHILMGLMHPNIVLVTGVTTDEGNVGLLMELTENGPIRDRLSAAPPRSISWKQKWLWTLDVLQGLIYLHNKGILHRDIKAANIFLDHGLRAKVGDFGLAVKVNNHSTTTTTAAASSCTVSHSLEHFSQGTAGTLPWLAPEIALPAHHIIAYTRSSDVYAFGMFLYELYSHCHPWEKNVAREDLRPMDVIILSNIMLQKRPTLELGLSAPPAFLNLIRSCWDQDPKKRPRLRPCVVLVKAELDKCLSTAASSSETTAAGGEGGGDGESESSNNNEIDWTLSSSSSVPTETEVLSVEEERKRLEKERQKLEEEKRMLAQQQQQQQAPSSPPSAPSVDLLFEVERLKQQMDKMEKERYTQNLMNLMQSRAQLSVSPAASFSEYLARRAEPQPYLPFTSLFSSSSYRFQTSHSVDHLEETSLMKIGGSPQGICFGRGCDNAADEGTHVVYVLDSGRHAKRLIRYSFDETNKTSRQKILVPSSVVDNNNDSHHLLSASFKDPKGIAMDANGKRLFVADTLRHDIQVIDSETGQLIRRFGQKGSKEGQLDSPCGVLVTAKCGKKSEDEDEEEELYVVDHGNHRVCVFSLEGEFRRAFGTKGIDPGQMIYPYAIAVLRESDDDEDCQLFVTEFGNHRVSVFNRLGQFCFFFGNTSNGGVDDSHLLYHPEGIAIEKGGSRRVVVTDCSDRIFLYNSEGEFLRILEEEEEEEEEEDEETKRKKSSFHSWFVAIGSRDEDVVAISQGSEFSIDGRGGYLRLSSSVFKEE